MKNNICLGLGSTSNEIICEFVKRNNKIVDVASIYSGINNLKICLDNGNIKRSDIIIVGKLWLDELGKNRTDWDLNWGEKDVIYYTKKLIEKLNCDYIDYILIHWPLKLDENLISEEFIIPELWIQMERLVDLGLTKKIGLSNFGILEIQTILNNCRIKPSMNQIEVNLVCNNNNVIDYCNKNNIDIMAHSIFRNDTLNSAWWLAHGTSHFEEKYKSSKYQIIINWLIKKNIIPIISTTKLDNLNNNLLSNNFILSDEDSKKLDMMNENRQLRINDYKIHHLEHNIKYNFYENYKVLYCDNDKLEFKTTYTNDFNFLKKCRDSLTIGPGFLIIKNLFTDELDKIIPKLPTTNDQGLHRWNNDVINRDIVFCKLIDNIIITTIIESILGWDCHMDNTAFSYSKYENGLNVPFGPHQDSPFDIKPGAPLPPFDYPLVIQCLYLFDDMNKDNGAFYTIPYSHKNKQRCNLFSEGNLEMGKVPEEKEIFITDAKAGDVLICLGNLWHGALANKNKKNRRVLLCEFVSSFIEKRDHLGEPWIKDMDILKDCSRKFIRFLNEGRTKWRDPQHLLEEWKKQQIKLEMVKHM